MKHVYLMSFSERNSITKQTTKCASIKINKKHLGFDRNMSSPSQLFLIGIYASIANSENNKAKHTLVSYWMRCIHLQENMEAR
jgi:hypothetical protein